MRLAILPEVLQLVLVGGDGLKSSLFLQDVVDTVVVGDAVEKMALLPDKSIEAVITDPPWPETAVDFGLTIAQLSDLWFAAAEQICRITDRACIIIGCDTDPRFLIPMHLPFFRVIWLRRIPPIHRGSLLYGSDVAYLFGHRRLGETARVIGGEIEAVVDDDTAAIPDEINSGLRPRGDNPHPCFRNLHHMRKLVQYLTKPGDIIVDPFAGSGTTCVAAKDQGRHYFGIDEKKLFVDYAIERLKGSGPPDKDVLRSIQS